MSDRKQPLRKMFITGIFFLFPIAVTWWLLNALVGKAQSISRPFVENTIAFALGESARVPNMLVTLVSLLIVIIFVILIGWLANFYFGKQLLNIVDTTMLKLPLVRSIYGGTKQIIEAFSFQRSSGSFQKVVLLEYPRRESWVLGFVTNEDIVRSEAMFGKSLVAVFVPSTPNPTTGFLLYLKASELYVLDISVEESVKLIVSAGLVVPVNPRRTAITLEESWKLKGGGPTLPTPPAL